MKMKIMAAVAACALVLAVLVAFKPKEADAHIDWNTAFNVCQLINVAYFENPTGQNYNVFRATDFNLFGHFAVGCTIYPARYTASPRGFVCYIYDRHTHELFWATCPTPP